MQEKAQSPANAPPLASLPLPLSLMSAYKKRSLPPPPRRDAFTSCLLAARPDAAPILASAASIVAAGAKAAPIAEWAKSRAAGVKHWQALINGWVGHKEAAKSDEGLRAEYAEAFGTPPPPTESATAAHDADAFGSAASESYIIAHLKRRSHDIAVRKAEASLSALRGCLSKMRAAFDELTAQLTQLQSLQHALHNLSVTIGEEGPEFAAKLCAAAEATSTAAASPLPLAGTAAAAPASVLALGENDEPFRSALDAALTPGSNLTIGAAVTALAGVVRVYARELHSKTALLQAIDVMIHHSEVDATVPSTSDSSHTLLPPLAASVDPSCFAPPLVTSVHALELYLSSWQMEPELDVDLLSSTQHLWESQLVATK